MRFWAPTLYNVPTPTNNENAMQTIEEYRAYAENLKGSQVTISDLVDIITDEDAEFFLECNGALTEQQIYDWLDGCEFHEILDDILNDAFDL